MHPDLFYTIDRQTKTRKTAEKSPQGSASACCIFYQYQLLSLRQPNILNVHGELTYFVTRLFRPYGSLNLRHECTVAI